MTRIAFISDIHANIDALQMALKHIDSVGADMTVCLGDVVGYGPCPNECVNLIREREIPTVLGNHDEYVTLIMDPLNFLRPEVREAISWTQGQLSMDNLKWLAQLPQKLANDLFFCLHASFAPKKWSYCLDEKSFKLNFQHQTCPLAFCGHSHLPLIAFDQGPEKDPFVDFIQRKVSLPADTKIMVNVGSVGQPRDRNPDSCVLFLEVEQRIVWLDRVHYNAKLVMEKIFATKQLSRRFGERLLTGR